MGGDLRSFNLREPERAARSLCTSQVVAPLSQHARIRLVRALDTREADIPHSPIAKSIRGQCGRVSLTNLCDQLVVTVAYGGASLLSRASSFKDATHENKATIITRPARSCSR